jgi:hypothetical protein
MTTKWMSDMNGQEEEEEEEVDLY